MLTLKHFKMKTGRPLKRSPKFKTAARTAHVRKMRPIPFSSYIRLVSQYPIRPIESDSDLARSIALLDRLIDKGKQLSPRERLYKMALADLIQHYENAHEPITKVPPAEMLRHLLEAREVSQAKLAADTGISEASVSEILSGKRPVSIKNRRRFSEYLKVDPAVFV